MSDKLIKIQQKVIQETEAYIEKLPFGQEKRKAEEMLRAHNQILYKIGHRKPKVKKESVKPSVNHFKKRVLTDGEKALIAKNSNIDNSHAPKDAFKKKEGPKKVAKKIDNSKAPEKNKFKKKEEDIVPSSDKKTGPKFKGRLSKERKMKILDLHGADKTPFEISSELWIDEKTIRKFLKLPVQAKPKKDVVLADNTKKGLESFVDEVKDSE